MTNSEFWPAACQYPRDLVLMGEMLQLLPFLKSYETQISLSLCSISNIARFGKFGNLFIRKRNRNIVYKYLTPLIRDLRRDHENPQRTEAKPEVS